ncbi:MAG: amidohydrolase [Xanthobacteraceae bacterium]|nr:amidohydrolase [Xanthobacteraceae bacterium]MBX3547921.1 amidohydrolase [Xanthobacteraceae bacterium]MCW5674653.1 amidohydrolase [Xanthobacteraceae bacterium]MCW5677002.1 amidohydrolase [Xanthobacteraceae bacterium]
MKPIVDMHAHYVSPALIEEAIRNGTRYGVKVEAGKNGISDAQLLFEDGARLRPFFKELCNFECRLPEMDASGIGVQVVSTWTDMAGDNLSDEKSAAWVRLQNETLAADVKNTGKRFAPMGTLPLRNVQKSIEELDYLVKELGVHSLELGTNVNGVDLDHADFRPLWKRIRELDVFVMLHPPFRPVGLERTGDYFLNNLISYPVDTTIAAARLLFSGIMQELPGLKICLAHSGGFLPYQIGRMDRGFEAHPACSKYLKAAPSTLLREFIFDSLTHNDGALSFLIDQVGTDRVVYGSDYPFEMLDPQGPKRLDNLRNLSASQRDAILGGNIRSLLNGLSA